MEHIFENINVDKKILKLFIKFLLSEGLYNKYMVFFADLKKTWCRNLGEESFYARFENPQYFLRGTREVNMRLGLITENKWVYMVRQFNKEKEKEMWIALIKYLKQFDGVIEVVKNGEIVKVEIPINVYGENDKIIFNCKDYNSNILPLTRYRGLQYVIIKPLYKFK